MLMHEIICKKLEELSPNLSGINDVYHVVLKELHDAKTGVSSTNYYGDEGYGKESYIECLEGMADLLRPSVSL